MESIQPLNGNILIQPSDGEERTAGGIIIPDSAKETPTTGTVIAVAADANDEIQVGDKVVYKRYGGTEITFDGKEYRIVPDGDVLAKIVTADPL